MSNAIHAVTMPKWGIEMTEGTVNQWNAREGQSIEKGAPLLEVETEKIINSVEAPASGTLRRIVARSGETRPVGSLLAVIAAGQVGDAEVAQFITGFKGATVSFEPDAEPDASAGSAGVQGHSAATAASARPAEAEARAADSADVHISPIAKRLADRLGVDVSRIRGTGRNGRITREDVEAYVAQSASGRTAGGTEVANPPTRARLSATRATIARRLLESKQTIPHYRLSVDVHAECLLHRAEEASREIGRRVTVNDLLVRACALALTRHPVLNAWLQDEELLQFAHADVAIAVATESGLITPVVRSADTKTLAEIAACTADLRERARRGALAREDLSGGTFTVSNLGMYGLSRFDAIINPPQVAILAAGAAEERAIARGGAAVVARVMTLTLSADHRIVDGAMGAAFLKTLRGLIEAPERL